MCFFFIVRYGTQRLQTEANNVDELLALGDGMEVSMPLMANFYTLHMDTHYALCCCYLVPYASLQFMYILFMIVDSHVHSYHASSCRKNC